MESHTPASYISPIAIDLGARYTGIYLTHYEAGTDLAHGNHVATTLVIPENGKGIVWSQVSRTQARHRVRNYKRRKMAKRLLRIIIEEGLGHPLEEKEWEALSGLLNRRGYNRIQADIDLETLDKIDPYWHAKTFPDYFDESIPLSVQAEELLNQPDRISALLQDADFTLNTRQLKARLKEEVDPDLIDTYLEVHKNLVDLFSQADADVQMGARHRRDYLANIRAELKKDSRLAELRSRIGEPGLYHLLGNISNLQLRALRWYFNDPSMQKGDTYQDARLLKVLKRWVEGWRPESEEEKKDRRTLLKALSEAGSALEWLKTTDPKLTIPPYEDQDNRRPPKDQTLWLNPEALERQYPKWRIWTNNLKKAANSAGWFEDLAEAVEPIDRASRLGRSDNDLTAYADARFLQRLLDRNKKLDPYLLRRLVKGETAHSVQQGREQLEKDLGAQHIKDFLAFCERYYREAEHARQGTWVASATGLLEAANLNPPRKQSLLHLLVANILGECDWKKADLERFCREVWLARQGRSTLKGLAEYIEGTRKKYGNLFNELLQKAQYQSQGRRKQQPSGKEEKEAFKEVLSAWNKCQEAADRIAAYLEHDEAQRARYANPFSIAQLYTLIETDRRGFSKTSLAAHMENNWRMSKVRVGDEEVARCSRLPADSVRPFDGVLRRILERQAIEIAKAKYQQLEAQFADNWPQSLRIPLIIEENRFAFTLELYDAKTLSAQAAKRKQVEKALELQRNQWESKLERIRKASKGLCPYTGKPLGERGEVDHILPRAASMEDAGSVYNSEANLIWASREGNQKKRDQRFTLADLAPAYLERQFGTTDLASIRQQIEQTVSKIPDHAPFTELSETEQQALRHALYLDGQSPAFRSAFQRLATRHKNRVNGTQAWLARAIMSQLTELLARKGCRLDADILRVTAEEVHRIRELLAQHLPALEKQAIQGTTSHAVDALCALATAISQSPELFELPEELAEDPEWLAGCLPKQFRIDRIEGLKPYSPKKDLSGVKLFKESLYAEHFLPVWAGQNEIRIGFQWNSAVHVTGKKPETLLQLVWPWLLTDSIQTPDEAMKAENPVCLRIDKRKALDLLHEAWHKPLPEDQLMSAQVLESLRYCTLKKELKAALWDQNKPSAFAKDPDQKKFTIKIKAPARSAFKYSGNLQLPAWYDWQRVLKSPAIAEAIESGKEPDWRKAGESLFRPGSTRQHKKSRRVFSLPMVDNPSGGIRLRRDTPDGYTYQLVAIGDYKVIGFAGNGESIDWKNPVLMPFLVDSKNISMAGELSPPSKSDEITYLDEWRVLKTEHLPEGIRKVRACPGTQDRMYVELTQETQVLSDWLGQTMDDTLQAGAEIKPTDKKSFGKHLEWIGIPRSNLFVLQLCPDQITYRFIVESSSRELRSAYLEGVVTAG